MPTGSAHFQPVLLENGRKVRFRTSSAKALSRKTMVVSPAGDSVLCQATIPSASGSTSGVASFSAMQASSVPAPMLLTTFRQWFCAPLDSQVEPELEEKLEQDVLFGSVSLQMID